MKPVIAIIGRPNVGKSTLFNRLARKNKAIVIDEPGATRDRNYADGDWHGRPFILIDTGGFEPTADGILAQMREQTTLAIEEADIILFLLDGRDGLTPRTGRLPESSGKSRSPFIISSIRLTARNTKTSVTIFSVWESINSLPFPPSTAPASMI